MFIITSRISTLISCRDYILMKKKGFVVSPSQLNKNWYENQKFKKSIKQNLIYVGRIRQEKGIFSLLEIIKNHPEVKLSVVGMDGILLGEITYPTLTTVEKNRSEIGSLAAEILIQKINKPFKWQTKKIILPCKLVERGSTGPI